VKLLGVYANGISQMPPVHVPLHVAPHEPQLLLSFEKLAHPPAQAEYPLLHAYEQLPPLQVGVALLTVVVHGVALQLPQWSMLVCVFTQVPPQFVVGDVQLQTPLLQVMPPAQANVDPHPPQLLLSVCSLTQAPLHAL
jgi:hypothetical protein